MPQSSVLPPSIGLVVEGQGDTKALPLLLRRYLYAQGDYTTQFGKPVCCNGRTRALVANGIEGYVVAAAARPNCEAVIVVLDTEGDDPTQLGPTLQARAENVCPLPVLVALAHHTFEDWIYSSAETLQLGLEFDPNRRGLGQIVTALPEKYVKPQWQPRLAERIDIALARTRSHSFDRLLRGVDKLRGGLSGV